MPPRFVEAPPRADGDGGPGDAAAWDVERPGGVRLADVGGMREMKDRLEAAFLAPLRNPGLRRLYGKSLRGGLLSDDAVRPGDPPPPWTDRLPPRLLLAAAVLPTLATIWFDRKKQP
ncbi:hypothetical protein AB0907_36590 [Streptomyces sp. NPDC006975]|uniref:hypothetical protein n=1 Tax=Streptomyces sp. NPDC006975 TaxID=3154310 RepID=UPI003455B4F7